MQNNKLRASAVAWLLLMPLLTALFFVGISDASVTPTLDETSWTKGIIDQSSDVKNVISEAIDFDGNLYVSYYDNIGQNLMFATNSGGIWINEVVDSVGIVGQFSSIAVDGEGGIHISYYDYTNDKLKFAEKTTGPWVINDVGSNDSVGKYNALVVDAEGNAHIIFLDSHNEDLRYATNSGGSWSIVTIDDYQVYATAMTLSDGVLHAAFVGQNGKVNYAYESGGNWTTEVVDDSTLMSPSVDIDIVNDEVCIAYTSSDKELKFAVRNAANDWAKDIIDDTTNLVSWVSMDVDSYDNAHITYYAFPGLYYAQYDEEWSLTKLDTTGGYCNAVVSDQNDKQHVVYIDPITESSSLSYLTNSGARWTTEIIDAEGDADKASSIAVDEYGNVHIAYYGDYDVDNVTRGGLFYANNMGGWMVELVDNSTSNVGINPSLALDSEGWAHISYYDGTGLKVLKYIDNVGGEWNTPILLDQTGDAGIYSSLAIGTNDSVHVAYLHQGSKNLMYITNSPGYWDPNIIDSSGTVDGPVSLATDSQGVPHVAYYRTDGMVCAEGNGTSWDQELLDANSELGSGISLFIDDQDQSYITYYNEVLTLLKYVNDVGGEWNPATVIASEGIVGIGSSIFVDSKGDEHIAYVEKTGDGILNYAEKRSGIWMYQKVDIERCGDLISMVMDSQGRTHVSYFDPIEGDLRYATSVSVPSAPTNLTVESNDGFLELNWMPFENDGGANVTEYRIYRAESSDGPYALISTVEVPTLTYYDQGLTNGEVLFYRIKAVNSEGSSPFSNEASGTPCTLPGAPEVAASGDDKAVVLDWNEPENGGADIMEYKIYRKNASGVFLLVATIDGDVTMYKDTGLENGLEYSYYVTAVNPAGEGPESDTVTAMANPSNDMIIIAVVIVIIAAAAIGAVVFLRSKGKL